MSGFTGYIQLVYVLVAALFVIGLHLMNSPATARRGNQVALTGMVIAVIATLVLLIHDGTVTAAGWTVIIVGSLLGSAVGLWAARTVQMTAMPQLVSAFNSVGGGAAALVAIYGYYEAEARGAVLGTTSVFTVLDVLIGSVTFSGSIIAAGKLQGWIGGQPIIFRGSRLLNVTLAVVNRNAAVPTATTARATLSRRPPLKISGWLGMKPCSLPAAMIEPENVTDPMSTSSTVNTVVVPSTPPAWDSELM